MTSAFGGSADLAIFNDKRLYANYSKFGYSYELPQGMLYDSDEANSYLAGLNKFRVKEFEVYSVTIFE
jgi:hypothetical protein